VLLLVSTAQIRRLGDNPLRRALTSLGGWPVAQRDWTPPRYSLEVLLGRLRGEYNERVLIEQWVGPDDKNSSVNILQVRPK
jgi:membrane metallo-endopeptidase-like protein 1